MLFINKGLQSLEQFTVAYSRVPLDEFSPFLDSGTIIIIFFTLRDKFHSKFHRKYPAVS